MHDTVPQRVSWPDGRAFAFTIFDDPDLQTSRNVRVLYEFLADLGVRTTKAVWPLTGTSVPRIGGATCQDPDYLRWVLELQSNGFEIALHNVAFHTSPRPVTAEGLEKFRQLFGHYPHSLANHSGCGEAIYWGKARLSGARKAIYSALHALKAREAFSGHVEGSPLFWGDICRRHITYVRNFTFGDINTLKACPVMPYHDPQRPYVNYWFAASEGADVRSFTSMIREEHQDRLAAEGGACIMYTHLACGFVRDGRISPRFKILMTRLSRLNGWFVPVNTLLEHLRASRGNQVISGRERARLERRWLTHKVLATRGRS